MNKKIIALLLCHTMHATIVEKIPLEWLKNTTFYANDQGASMLLGQLFIRLENKKMDLGRFLAELLQLLALENKKNRSLEKRILELERQLLPPAG